MDEQPATRSVPAVVKQSPLGPWTIFLIVGLLLVGAGVCTGVQQAAPGSTLNYGENKLDLAGWQALARQHHVTALSTMVGAYELLSWSIGLFLGGTSLWFFGWSIRPSVGRSV